MRKYKNEAIQNDVIIKLCSNRFTDIINNYINQLRLKNCFFLFV